MKLECGRQILEVFKYKISWKSVSGSRVVPYVWTDRQIWSNHYPLFAILRKCLKLYTVLILII